MVTSTQRAQAEEYYVIRRSAWGGMKEQAAVQVVKGRRAAWDAYRETVGPLTPRSQTVARAHLEAAVNWTPADVAVKYQSAWGILADQNGWLLQLAELLPSRGTPL